jgi:hypothetical protein
MIDAFEIAKHLQSNTLLKLFTKHASKAESKLGEATRYFVAHKNVEALSNEIDALGLLLTPLANHSVETPQEYNEGWLVFTEQSQDYIINLCFIVFENDIRNSYEFID